ncbi:hypothetical protein SAMN05421841_1737 [Chryseobacterium wanjuense]|jgi:hypothetical protein|uniref:DUF3941 domain-containing protein n=1 Tax=Chryseobacterium wanjuense TaxID=356305 RepID=A0A1I0Q8R4_9FLAO|nr:hypothetical protein [Chryseobacterium wanjuense]SEW23250.1 hypothetical protein SAMN05421841_1737 [Chryseobacterium wanjuense]
MRTKENKQKTESQDISKAQKQKNTELRKKTDSHHQSVGKTPKDDAKHH